MSHFILRSHQYNLLVKCLCKTIFRF
jgi:hypothetical protein